MFLTLKIHIWSKISIFLKDSYNIPIVYTKTQSKSLKYIWVDLKAMTKIGYAKILGGKKLKENFRRTQTKIKKLKYL